MYVSETHIAVSGYGWTVVSGVLSTDGGRARGEGDIPDPAQLVCCVQSIRARLGQ